MSLKSKTVTAVFWSALDIVLRRGLTFVVTIVLARLLTPEDFGLVALLSLFAGIAGVIVDSGFSASLIQKQDCTLADESTAFWFNAGMGIFLGSVLSVTGPLVADFYGRPVLAGLMTMYGLITFVSALGSVHEALLTKRLKFRLQLNIGVIATTVSGILAMQLAWSGYGVWSLVIQQLVMCLVTTALLWRYSTWRPRAAFSLSSARNLFSFGGYLFATNILHITYSRLYSVLLGRYGDISSVGFYNRADSTKQIPVDIVTRITTRVAFPVFSQVQNDPEKMLAGVRFSVRAIMLVTVPMMLGLMFLADQLIPLLFGENWLDSVPIMQVLCIGAIFWPLHVINLNVLKAQGHSRIFFWLAVVKSSIGIVLMFIGVQWGVMGVAWSTVVYSIISFVINTKYTAKQLNYGWQQQIIDTIPSLSISLLMIAVMEFASHFIELPSLLEFVLFVLIGGVTFLGACVVFRLRSFYEIVILLKSHRSKSLAG